MTEPVTTQKSLVIPATGDLAGAWGTAALNPNFQMIDTMLGGLTTIALSGATTLALTVPPPNGNWTSGTLAAQSVNSLIRFTGAQTGSATIQFTLPGYYIIENKCTGTTSVRLQPSNLTGNCIGAIPGKKCHVFFDGTHMDYLNQSDPGTAYDLHSNISVSLPPWMQACTVQPYLVKNGATYSTATYPALAQLLGSTYGGNGVTTFGVPDESGRMRLPFDYTGVRVTSAGSGILGTQFGAHGGNQFMQAHSHVATPTVTDPGHTHSSNANAGSVTTGGGGIPCGAAVAATINSNTTGISVSVANSITGSGASQNMPPCIVSVLALIKT